MGERKHDSLNTLNRSKQNEATDQMNQYLLWSEVTEHWKGGGGTEDEETKIKITKYIKRKQKCDSFLCANLVAANWWKL